MWPTNGLTQRLGIEVPIVQAPLGGGPGTPELTAAVSGAGGLGVLGLAYASPDAARQAIRRVRELTDRPFGANLFLPTAPVDVPDGTVDRALEVLAPFRTELGLGPQRRPDRAAEDFDAQLEVLLAERVPVVGFTFGVPPAPVVDRVRRSGALLWGTATTVEEGKELQDAGVDVVCAQGAEAGGHRASFRADPATDLVGLVALVPALADALTVPVVACGGIADGRGVLAALVLGASAAGLGTAFLRCPEAATNAAYRTALAAADSSATVVTDAFSGKPARGVRNRYTEQLRNHGELPPFPLMNALTRDLRSRAAELGRADVQSLWAGQAVALGRDVPAADLVADLAKQVDRLVAGFR